MSAICRNTARSSAGCTSVPVAVPGRRLPTAGRYCRSFATVKPKSFFQHDHAVAGACLLRDHVMTLGFGGARQVADATRVVEHELQEVTAVEVGERDFRLRPRERARD